MCREINRGAFLLRIAHRLILSEAQRAFRPCGPRHNRFAKTKPGLRSSSLDFPVIDWKQEGVRVLIGDFVSVTIADEVQEDLVVAASIQNLKRLVRVCQLLAWSIQSSDWAEIILMGD